MLEQLFDMKSIKGSSLNIVLIGIIYGFIGTFSALLLFPNYVSIMSLAFTSILLIPSIGYLIQKEENIVAKERHFSIRVLFKDHKDIMRLYILLFLDSKYLINASAAERAVLISTQSISADFKVSSVFRYSCSFCWVNFCRVVLSEASNVRISPLSRS